MKLTYKILWIEDKPDTVQPFDEAISDLLDDHGFEIDIEYKKGFEDTDIELLKSKLTNYNPYDFIVFDYDLGAKSKSGLEIAKKLRSNIFTDMIFYSAKTSSDLRGMLYKSHVDGVFIVRRDHFIDDISPIITDHIKRISDINNMRGLLLDEMSQCDAIIRDLLINKYQSLIDEKKLVVSNRLRETVKNSYKSNLPHIGYKATFTEAVDFSKDFPELVKDYFRFDFDKIRRRLVSVLSELNENNDFLKNDALTHKLQKLRNVFAHQKAEQTDNSITLAGEEYGFSEFLQLRKDLLELKKLLRTISE